LETLDSFKTSTSLEDLEGNKEQENSSGAKKKSPINGINTGGKICALSKHVYHILSPQELKRKFARKVENLQARNTFRSGTLVHHHPRTKTKHWKVLLPWILGTRPLLLYPPGLFTDL